ncbi:unnamed protein product [Nyctereutes procyonoides]|uniref:(raccoon dog) hypothetical protein n=1 Tax=Nyctereutes procyonoides TaxID=34880 RepID=A0A811Z5E8_NYCPR|nr:unnamed protein product [Nyctereutes procyonoides]
MLYKCLARQTNSTFNQVVLKRLFISRTNQPPLSLFQMIQKMKLPGQEDKTSVVVGIITHDVCVQEVPKPKVYELPRSSLAQRHTHKARGKILTFDQLTLDSPRSVASVYRHSGKSPGTPPSHKLEHARGCRASWATKSNPGS